MMDDSSIDIYEIINLKTRQDNKRPLFAIVAGTSIGATNAAVLVSNVVKKKIKQRLKQQKGLKDSGETA